MSLSFSCLLDIGTSHFYFHFSLLCWLLIECWIVLLMWIALENKEHKFSIECETFLLICFYPSKLIPADRIACFSIPIRWFLLSGITPVLSTEGRGFNSHPSPFLGLWYFWVECRLKHSNHLGIHFVVWSQNLSWNSFACYWTNGWYEKTGFHRENSYIMDSWFKYFIFSYFGFCRRFQNSKQNLIYHLGYHSNTLTHFLIHSTFDSKT